MTTRRELSFQACDALAAQGIKPAMSSVRKWTYENSGGKRGSDTDVQGDINAWYDALLQLKRTTQAIPGMPEHVAAQALQMWIAAREAALDTLDSERVALDEERLQMQTNISQAESAMHDALAQADATRHQLDVAREKSEGLHARITTLESAAAEQRAMLSAQDERIAGLTGEVGRKTEAHAALLAEIDGVRKHSLLEIDTARTEARRWKTQCERLDRENKSQVERSRQRAEKAEMELATARGRLEAIEAELSRRIAAEAAALLVRPTNTQDGEKRGLRVRLRLAKNARTSGGKGRIR